MKISIKHFNIEKNYDALFLDICSLENNNKKKTFMIKKLLH